jgi:hypothetical protein
MPRIVADRAVLKKRGPPGRTTVTGMCIPFLPHDGPRTAVALDRDRDGLEVRRPEAAEVKDAHSFALVEPAPEIDAR